MQHKIIICVCGGLGNQFFQYATAYAVAKNNNYKLSIDITSYYGYILNEVCGYQLINIIPNLQETKHPFYCKILTLPKPISWVGILIKIVHRRLQKRYKEKIEFCYDSSINNIKPNTFLCGYFQSYKYFTDYSDDIINMFSKLPLSKEALEISYKIEQQTNSTVAIHYRDYADIKTGDATLADCNFDLDYYKKAIAIINKKCKKTKFYVFSNKIITAKKVLHEIENLEFIEYVYDNTWEDMKLMSLCNHNIIANSTYSWWSAYLNTNNNKIVIASKSWGNLLEYSDDLLPADWIKI